MQQLSLKYLSTALFAFIFCFIHAGVDAQNFGGNSSYIKWQQINTDTARIIFPKGLETQAVRAATIIHHLQQTHDNSIGNKIKKINIVLQNYTTISNGYVGLAPYRSEYFLNPPQDPFELGAVNWLDNLATHEWRHVEQYSNFNTGLSKVASFILGEQGQALANATSVPDWFYEGDAVLNETKLSNGGRGRLPLFFSEFKSIALNNLHYSYMQFRNGSLKKNIPNHYNLGYLLVAYGAEKYGADIWKKVTIDAAGFKPLFYPMQGAIKKYTGIPFNEFVKNAFGYYDIQWKNEKESSYEFITPLKVKDVVNYQYPYVTDEGNIIVLKNSNKKISAFYTINKKGHEEKIAVKNISIDDYYSYNNGKIVYVTYKPDARWNNKDYSQIVLLDIASRKTQTIKEHKKYFSPDISHDGKKIIAVEIAPEAVYGTQSKVMMMNADGIDKKDIGKPGYLFSYPKFSLNDSMVYAISRNIDGSCSIVKLKDGYDETLFSTSQPMGFLQVTGDTILFTITNGKHDELWGYSEKQHNTFLLSSINTGLYKGDKLNDSSLISSTPTAFGYKLIKLKSNSFKPTENLSNQPLYVSYTEFKFNKTKNDSAFLQNLPERSFTVSKYRKGFHLFNFHSWRPYYDRPEWSFTVYGENILNTLQSEAAYTYNENEQSHQIKYTGTYGGSYVQPFVSVSETFNRTTIYNNSEIHWNEVAFSPGLQLPLNLSGGKQYRNLRLFSIYNLLQRQWTGIAKNVFENNSLQYLHSGIFYSWQIQKAVQQIFPRLAQNISVQYKTMVNNYTANQLLANTTIYFPGFFNNHSIVISAAYQARDTAGQYNYSNNFPFSRGYTVLDYPRIWKLSANYHLPLLYPDWGFANIVYFLRVRGNVFYDHTVAESLRTGSTFPFRTLGAELIFDTRWWNSYPVSFGIRYDHLLDNGIDNRANANRWEFILPVLF